MNKKVTALWLAVSMALMTCTVSAAAPFEPWSRVGDYWISADGKSVIKGALARGVTISKYQNRAGNINWKQVSLDNISFVMVRLGYLDDQDPYFDTNMRSADSVGIRTGVLFYGEALTAEDARREAEYVLDTVKDYRVSYPIGYDISSQYLDDQGFTKKQVSALVSEFCQVIEAAGYKAAVFGEHDWLTKNIDPAAVPYDIWYSRYGLANAFQNRTIWRSTDSGRVKGIPGNVCIEFSFEDYRKTFEPDGWRKINGTTYYFNNYKMLRNATVQIDDRYYYFDKDGINRSTR